MDNNELKNKVDDLMDKARDFLDLAGKKVSKYANVVAEKSEDVYDSTKRKLESEKILFSLKKKYTDLGEAYYKNITDGTEIDKTLIDDIKTLNEALEVLKVAESETVEDEADENEFQAEEVVATEDDKSDLMPSIEIEIVSADDENIVEKNSEE